jgi:alkylated DNA repair dioxygenase AlkB
MDAPGTVRCVETLWLVEDPLVERLDLGSGAWIEVVRGLVPAADRVHDELIEQVSWQQGRVYRYEKWVEEPRLGGWQAGDDRHPALVAVQDWLTRRYRIRFDGVALARYRHGADSQGLHRDRELRWLEHTVIGVLTLGAQRPWLVKPLGSGRSGAEDDMYAGSGDVLDLQPAGGDLLVMGGRCQAAFLHGVPRVRDRAVGDRISAQWRWTSRRGRPDTNPGYYAPRHYSR